MLETVDRDGSMTSGVCDLLPYGVNYTALYNLLLWELLMDAMVGNSA